MGMYITVALVCILVVAMVVVLSLITLKKGYGYNHSVDPLPDEEKPEDGQDRNSTK